jgi:hypothetical protein
MFSLPTWQRNVFIAAVNRKPDTRLFKWHIDPQTRFAARIRSTDPVFKNGSVQVWPTQHVFGGQGVVRRNMPLGVTMWRYRD